ncbi:MAG: SUMF1/EgtB/PvdO family nonheme iron enzyme [Verrucomicrobiota bacterium]
MRTCLLPFVLAGLTLVGGAVFASAQSSSNSFLIPATEFDRGNVKIHTSGWGKDVPMVAYGGQSPIVVEYDLEFPVAAEYTLFLQFAALQSRPAELAVDGKELGQCCRVVTGSWNTSGAQWERAVAIKLTAGKHTIKLEREGSFPHVTALRFESDQPFPSGWTLKRQVTPKTIVAAKTKRSAPPEKPFTPEVSPASLRLAIHDLINTYGSRYAQGQNYLDRLDQLEAKLQQTNSPPAAADASQIKAQLVALQREALLANPLLDFNRLLFIKRRANAPSLGLPANWQSNSSLPLTGYDDVLCMLALDNLEAGETNLFAPGDGRFIGDVDLHFDANRLLLSMPGTNKHWQVFEASLNTPKTSTSRKSKAVRPSAIPTVRSLRQLTGEQPDVDYYDACYLPDGRIIFGSTACFVGVPCVYGSSHVANLYLMNADGKNIRQLCFDQEHDWCPTVLNNGRILYTRWEYTDTPHSNTRLLFHMNPDGTEQMEFMGSNSYWPNSFFYARPIPGHPTKVVAVISGHHGDRRMGELVIFDPAKGRFEAEGAVQKIPGYGKKVEMVFKDQLTVGVWPKFLHPYPLSEKHFLVSCKPAADALWGLYLVDIYDNMVPLKQLPGFALLEPVPFRATTRPPVIPDKVNPNTKDAVVYIQDIYAGSGTKGLPRGTIKSLRVFTYHFAYHGMGGLLGVLGLDGPWDIRRVLGTVPVQADGSVQFRVPANTPISVQPLDAEGKAVQLMRSWMTAMPGEVLQCAGCHEKQSTAPMQQRTLALSQPPVDIQPWHGPVRGFSYPREVQPVMDKYCVSCHDGQARADGKQVPDLRGTVKITDYRSVTPGNGGTHAGKFSVGYAELHRYVRRPGIESDYHVLEPMEFHADTTDLVQLLKAGHYNVKLDSEAWDRLITWIDMNCPYHATWSEELAKPGTQVDRRHDLLLLYGGVDSHPEAVPTMDAKPVPPVIPEPMPAVVPAPKVAGWPFDAKEAVQRQQTAGAQTRKTIDLGDGITFELALIPAGDFVMGDPSGELDQRPAFRARIDQPFWMATCEINNRTYAKFDSSHDSRIEDKNTYQFGVHGYPANKPEQPVVRVSWQEAMAFCRWLSGHTGLRFNLPTEAQWEYACRAGSADPFYYGGFDTDFSKYANLADKKLSEFASDPYTVDVPLKNPTKYDDWLPKDSRFNDGALITVASGQYQPNAWGLHDMHGNAAEWTRSTYLPYPAANDDRDREETQGRKVARGGSWHDVPKRATSSFRASYLPHQRVYNVGFRVICETGDRAVALGR